MQIKVKSNDPRSYVTLSAETPMGARITSDPPIETKMFDLSSNLDISINIDLDLTKIVTHTISAWFIKNLLKGKGKAEIHFDGQKVSIDQPNATKLIEDAINQHKP